MPGLTFGFVKLLASSGSHCTKWSDEQHRQAGFESRLVPDLPLPFIPTLIGLRAFDLVSSRVWWEAATNTWLPLALFICSWLQTSAPENTICGKKKNDWLKNWPFFIIENFLGILKRLCAEPMRRNHDFLSLTLAIVGSTSGSCYFLLQCRCLSVCVLCVLVLRCVKT